MIGFFPQFYNDELVYSLLSRYYMGSGYLTYRDAAEDLFINRNLVPSIEFIDNLKPEIIQLITRGKSMDAVIQQHTMFPYYGRFVSMDKRVQAVKKMKSMDKDYRNLLAISVYKKESYRCLRYCPVCAKKDRQMFGETYWHRSHQIREINICYRHDCQLINSDVLISSKSAPGLIAAEKVVPNQNDILISKNTIEKRLVCYVSRVFQSPVDMGNEVDIGEFFHSRLTGTPYLSVRGEQRKVSLLYHDFMEYYKGLPKQGITELWQMQKIFNNKRLNAYEICQMAEFLKISVEEIVNMRLPDKSQKQVFDEKIKELHDSGMNYMEISKALSAPYDTVKAIGEGLYKRQQSKVIYPKKCGVRPRDWNRIDLETLPKVKKAIKQLQGDGIDRPRRVTEYAICRMLNLPDKRFHYLPMCRAEIKKNMETQEEYWIREIGWAVKKIEGEGETLNWKHIRELTNMKRGDFDKYKSKVRELRGIEI